MSLAEDASPRVRLERRLRELGARGRVAVALSAGVDSTLLLEMAHRVLDDDDDEGDVSAGGVPAGADMIDEGDVSAGGVLDVTADGDVTAAGDVPAGGVLAVTAASPFVPAEEVDAARALCEERGIESVVVELGPLAIEGVRDNPRDRCYRCKRVLMGALIEAARERGCAVLADGTNADDVSGGSYRPGLRALDELGVASPLAEAGLTKAEVRELARELGLLVWDKPAAACLATRFPYGTRLTREGLERVAAAERILRGCGLTQVRVRVHGDASRGSDVHSADARDDLAHGDDARGDLARIEVLPEEFGLLLADGRVAAIDRELRALGFARVTLDLAGFASGSWD